MKIESIHLENFGIYGSKRFRFDGQPLVLIYGANESGKTTALNGLRQALFGFPRNSAYLTGKTMSAEGQVTLTDGRRIRFHRQKKNSDGFSATIDNKIPLTETEWNDLASGLDLKAYQSLFGFSLDELRSGEKALAHAPIEQALAASGFGGLARLQAVQNRIEGFLGEALKRVGSSGLINAKLAEIEQAEKHLESVLTLPADVAALRSQLATAQEQVQQQQAKLNQLREQLLAAQRQQTALPASIQYQQVQQSLAQYNLPPSLDSEFRLEWTVTCNRLAGLRSELASETRKLQELQGELASLPVTEGASAHQATAIALGKRAREVPTWRNQLADCLREASEMERELSESLRKLGWSLQDSRWRQLNLDLNQHAEIEAARQSLDSLNHQLTQVITRIDLAEKQLQPHRQPTAQSDACMTWDRVVELETQLRSLRPLAHELDQHRKELQRLRQEPRAKQLSDGLQRLTAELCTRCSIDFEGASEKLPHDWQVPSVAEAKDLQSQLSQAEREVKRLTDTRTQLQQQRDLLQQEISQSQAKAGVKTLPQLEALWRQRDEIVGHWREELSAPLLASTVTPTEYEERLTQLQRLNAQSDTAVRAMLAAVEQVAILAAKERELVAMEQSLTSFDSQLNTAQIAHQELVLVWQKLWSACSFTHSIAQQSAGLAGSQQLIEWLDLYRQWQQLEISLQHKGLEYQSAETAYGQARQALCQLWPQAAELTSLSQAEQLVARMRSQLATVDAQATMLKGLEQTYSTSLSQRRELERQLESQRTTALQVLTSVGLPDSWPLQEVSARIESLRRCQKQAARIEELRGRRAALEQQLSDFTAAVQDLGRQLGLAELTSAPEVHATTWMDQFLHRQQADHRRLELASLIADQQTQCAKRAEQIRQSETEQARLVNQIGGASIEQVQGWIQQSATVIQLRARQTELVAALESNAQGRSLAEFLEELATLNPRSVTATVATLNAQVSSLDADVTAAQQAVGGLARELEFKEQGSAAMIAEQKLKQLRTELVDLSEQWAVHRLAGELLARTIDRFTRDHEPQLLKHTRRFFKELTDDRYGMVEHDSGKHGGFTVRDQHGNAWEPDKLSTGTREQLYLSIRLAFITHFNATHEPLPVIMDDCFVNFDDTRARIALRTLINWHESVQTILLSCHWRSIEALAELAPETPVLDLASSQLISARELSVSRHSVP